MHLICDELHGKLHDADLKSTLPPSTKGGVAVEQMLCGMDRTNDGAGAALEQQSYTIDSEPREVCLDLNFDNSLTPN